MGFKELVGEILKAFWLPIGLILIALWILHKITNIKNEGNKYVILGVIIGVFLGFIANITNDSLINFTRSRSFRKASYNLLRQDAEQIYTTVWLYNSLLEAQDVEEEVKRNNIPPEFDMFYWDRLKNNNDFLLLAGEPPFDEIFKDFDTFDKINEEIRLAKAGDKRAWKFARAFYVLVIEDKKHEKLLKIFLSEAEIEKLKNSLNKKAKKT